MKQIKYLVSFIFLICIVILFLVCDKTQKKPRPKVSSKETLVIGAASDLITLNPFYVSTVTDANVNIQLFLGLIKRDKDLSFVPDLAESWEFSQDYKTLIYKIRKGMLWSDEIPLTAYDVEYSYRLAINPEVAFKDIMRYEMIENVEVVDEHTVKITFKDIYSEELSDTGFPIVPKHILSKIPPEKIKNSEFSFNPITCGPFKFEKWDLGQQWSIVPNEKFFRGKPAIGRVIYQVVPDEFIRLMKLKANEIDIMENISPYYYDQVKNLPNIKLVMTPSNGFTFIGWNLQNPILKSAKIRRALTMALNREEIIDRYFLGIGQLCTSPIVNTSWAYNKDIKPMPYNIEKAKQLLAEEGWKDSDGDGWLDKDGKKFSLTIKTNNNVITRVNIITYITAQYKQLGIEIIGQPMEFNSFVDDLFKRNFDGAIVAFYQDFALKPLKTMWYSSLADKEGTYNISAYKNAEIDSLLDIGLRTLDEKEAKKIWNRFQEILYYDQPYTFILTENLINGVNKRVKGPENADIRGLYYEMYQWWIESPE